jgi:hypothetical protein
VHTGAGISIRSITGAQLIGVADPVHASRPGVVKGTEEKVTGHTMDAVAVQLAQAGEDVLGERDFD